MCMFFLCVFFFRYYFCVSNNTNHGFQLILTYMYKGYLTNHKCKMVSSNDTLTSVTGVGSNELLLTWLSVSASWCLSMT